MNGLLQVAGVILEPVVGNGGFIVPTQEFLQGLRDLCTEVRAACVRTGVRVLRVHKGVWRMRARAGACAPQCECTGVLCSACGMHTKQVPA